MQLTIRKADLNDIDAIVGIHRRSWDVTYSGLIPRQHIFAKNAGRFAMWEQILSKPNHTYLALVQGEPVGFSALLSPCRDMDVEGGGEIGALYLAPEWQGRGIGGELLREAVKTLRTLGHKTIVLWVLSENCRARHVYEKCGFTPDGATKDLAPGIPVMELRYRIG